MWKADIYSEILPGFGLKVRALPISKAGKDSCAPTFCMHKAHSLQPHACPRRMRNAPGA